MIIDPNNISYKDTAARIVEKESGYYRYIFYEYKQEYDHLMKSGLYAELTKNDLLIEHQEIELDTDDPKVYKQLRPSQISFQSYPFEWSYTQWRKSILTYLRINQIALKYKMILKDATPYNIYLSDGKAIMFDTSSFIFFKENDIWLAYRQFCEEFLSPVSLMHYNGSEWSKLTMSNLSGMPLSFVSKQLPLKSWFNLTTLLHIHIHSKYSGYRELINHENKKNKGFTITKIISLQNMIFNTISGWDKPFQFKSHWSSYYENDIESPEYLKDKEDTIRAWLQMIKPKSILDLGSNTGKFSFIATEYAKRVISLESDLNCVDEIEKKITTEKTKNLIALVGNLSEPTPGIGYLNINTRTICNRSQSDVVLALAISHHLYFTNKFSFDMIANILKSYCNDYIIVEFVLANDNKVIALTNNNINKDYNELNFKNSMNRNFSLIESKFLQKSSRIIYLYKKVS